MPRILIAAILVTFFAAPALAGRSRPSDVRVSKSAACICPQWAAISPDDGATATFIVEGKWSPMRTEWVSTDPALALKVQCQPENSPYYPGDLARACMVVEPTP